MVRLCSFSWLAGYLILHMFAVNNKKLLGLKFGESVSLAGEFGKFMDSFIYLCLIFAVGKNSTIH